MKKRGATRKGMRVQARILKCLENEASAISTRQLTLKTGFSWNTVQQHCLKLFIDNKLSKIETSGFYLWSLQEKQAEHKPQLSQISSEQHLIEEALLQKTLSEEIDKQIQVLQKQLEELRKKRQEKKYREKEIREKEMLGRRLYE